MEKTRYVCMEITINTCQHFPNRKGWKVFKIVQVFNHKLQYTESLVKVLFLTLLSPSFQAAWYLESKRSLKVRE